ncbi:MAG: hypothetical protein A3F43_02015 [Gammaproteobacteria bacterium RIFCSPHIGHO2_12_FULL_42_10]|nr:MAG: hypothetical protein A3F43_02015 [Gammaproteobacteria bacterium RIFCSPHIGHO2_12_FULL_42_10]
MFWRSQNKLILIGFATTLCLISSPAFAYIDPGMGSMWIQSMLALTAGFGVAFKMYWQRVKLFIFGNKKKPSSERSDKNHQENIT